MSNSNRARPESGNEMVSHGEGTGTALSGSRSSVSPRPAPPAESWRSYWKLCVQPLLFLVGGILLLAALGLAQRMGWITAAGHSGYEPSAVFGVGGKFICPMMCTPPQSQPGRCPVCAMELVPATSGAKTDSRSIQIDAATRRIANIQTAAVTAMPWTRSIRTVGELRYDEGTLKSISAYVDGRLERLYADFTGVVVKKGDHLALLYSPRLYSGQTELLLIKKARDAGQPTTLNGVNQSRQDLYASAKQRLIELGMTESQIEQLEREGVANSRLHLCAPNSGTVIEKMATEGQYVKEGDAIYRLADLSNVWLMLRLFPEDAAAIRYGQKVSAEVQSLPGRSFAGRVAFVDPTVDAKTRTVGVRVVIANPEGQLRVGDYAKATIQVPVGGAEGLVHDPELANKWISPRHPQVLADGPGKCPICGVALVPAATLGFTDQSKAVSEVLVVPRDAVLLAGKNSVVYVEVAPGRFEIRRVVLGPNSGDHVVIQNGVKAGERVATRGNFLIDSQMQLAGNPSLIDPSKATSSTDEAKALELLAGVQKLPAQDRELAVKQKICPVANLTLGSMGTPIKVDVQGTPVFICCEGCRDSLLAAPAKYLAKLSDSREEKATQETSNAVPDLPPIGKPQLIEPDKSNSEANVDKHSEAQPAGNASTAKEPAR